MIDPDKIFKNYYVEKLRVLYIFCAITIGIWVYTENVSILQFIIVIIPNLLILPSYPKKR